jgi:hypothetical protein
MNHRIFMLACIAVCLAAALLAGCATTNQLVPAATGPIPANSARIVVSRGSGFVGAAAPIGIIDSGKQIGAVGLNDQISWDRIAGSMELVGFNTLSPPSFERAQPLRVCVGAGKTYQFKASWPTFSSKWFPDIELVSGTPVACEQTGTASTVKAEQVQQPSAQVGDTKIIKGTIESFPHGFQFKSGPPLWPAGMIVVAADNGEKSNILIVGSGTSATIFYDAEGTARGNLADGNAQVTVGKKVEVKYLNAPVNYATKALAISVRYLAETPTTAEGVSGAASAGAQTSASAIPLENQNILGISVEPTSGVRGVVVKTVSPGSPCEGVLKQGDTIFAFDLIGQGDSRVGGAKVNASNFQAEVSKIQPGMTVKMILNLRSIRQVSCTIPANTRPLAPQRQ